MAKIQHNSIIFDSQEEIDFYEWLLEAKELNIVIDFEYHPKQWNILPKQQISNSYSLRELKYTPDFKIKFNLDSKFLNEKEMLKYFKTFNICEYVYVDVKGTFSRFNDSTKFSLLQKIIFYISNRWVTKIIPEKLFKSTWVPEYARYTSIKHDLRKKFINCLIKENIKEYLNESKS